MQDKVSTSGVALTPNGHQTYVYQSRGLFIRDFECYLCVQTVCSMSQTKARTPTSVLRASSCRTACRSEKTFSSSTIVITAEFISGQVCVPRRGSPVLVPRPCTCSNMVKPLISSISSIYSTRSVLA